MNLVIDNNIIDSPILDILKGIQKKVPQKNLFSTIEDKGEYYRITCPIHKGGQEQKPSCSVYKRNDNDRIVYGTCHCFTCGYKAQLYKMVSDCFECNQTDAEDWLIENFSNQMRDVIDIMPAINFSVDLKQGNYIDESILEEYKYFHPYMFKRKLTEDVIRKFSIGFDIKTNSVTFPVWDEYNNLVTITRRSVEGKRFQLESDKDKPVYLLNFLLNDNVQTAYICESQINALTLQSYGLPGVALFGTGSQHQYNILNKSGIRNYVLCFDGDEAGRKGANRFKQNINKGCFIVDLNIPYGKDVNDLSKDQFFDILNSELKGKVLV